MLKVPLSKIHLQTLGLLLSPEPLLFFNTDSSTKLRNINFHIIISIQFFFHFVY